ncbi:putative acetyltransferase [Camellia lanceoleosa]|uniref:Acetyltransferase n=1 Tax=Camellia lanceoleosa TaxID=1840588 RepID=A0ACC0GZH0_9ERIC|nr:putative acetyltransferase [Camellia lanceoleosa]
MPCSTIMSSSQSQSQSLVVSNCTVFPDCKSIIEDLKLSISDLSMLSYNYTQKGCLFTRTPLPIHSLLKNSLSRTLTHFSPLAGRLSTDSKGHFYVTCNDSGVHFLHANASHIHIRHILSSTDVPDSVKDLFAFDWTVSYEGHFNPILAVQVTELADDVFIGGGAKRIPRPPDFRCDSVLISSAVLGFPDGAPKVTFSLDAPLRERIFSFSRDSILKLKAKVNNYRQLIDNGTINTAAELIGKQSNDRLKVADGKFTAILKNLLRNGDGGAPNAKTTEISSFQSLCALLWQAVTRERKLLGWKTTTFRMAVNCRHRLQPKLDPYYFGNAIQSIPIYATTSDVLSRDFPWCTE